MKILLNWFASESLSLSSILKYFSFQIIIVVDYIKSPLYNQPENNKIHVKFMLNISSPSPLIFVKYAKTLIGLSISIFIITILYRYRLSRSISFVSDKLEYIGKRTLEIYVLQCFIVEIITPIFLKVPYFSLWSDICIFPLMAVGFLFIILIAENILAYIPFIHKLLFGK